MIFFYRTTNTGLANSDPLYIHFTPTPSTFNNVFETSFQTPDRQSRNVQYLMEILETQGSPTFRSIFDALT